jgi:hypothetical protein
MGREHARATVVSFAPAADGTQHAQAIDHHERRALRADSRLQFVLPAQGVEQVRGMFEGQLLRLVEAGVGLEDPAEELSPAQPRDTTADILFARDRLQQPEQGEQTRERGGVATGLPIAHEEVDLGGRASAVAFDARTVGCHVAAVELADPFVAESRPGADGAGPGLVMDHAKSQIKALAVPCVTIVRDSHDVDFPVVVCF